MDQKVRDILRRIDDGELPSTQEIACLLGIDHRSATAGWVMASARELARAAAGNRGEVCVQIGVNVGPCPRNCLFCSFADANGCFPDASELPVEDVVERAVRAEVEGANSIYLMATGAYPLARFLEVGREVRRNLRPETPLVANIGDLNESHARSLRDAGFCAAYHALRMGEGRDTGIDPARRMRSFAAIRAGGLQLGTCVEPIGPEHSNEEILEKILVHRDAQPCFSGAMRRIPIPGTGLAARGQLSELRLAYLVAVARLAMGRFVIGNCTHEPNVLGACAGANMFWAEIGPNPRDTEAATERGRGLDLAACRRMLEEADYEQLVGPSVIHTRPRLSRQEQGQSGSGRGQRQRMDDRLELGHGLHEAADVDRGDVALDRVTEPEVRIE